MNIFSDLRHPKEPKQFTILRTIFITLIALILFVYFAYLAYAIHNDRPVIEIEQNYLDRIKVPDIEICGWGSDLYIKRCVFTFQNYSKVEHINCTSNTGINYIVKTPYNQPNNYCYQFSTESKLYFSQSETYPNDFRKIGIFLKFLDISKAETLSYNLANAAVQLINPDFNFLWNRTPIRNEADLVQLKSLKLQDNNFSIVRNHSTIIKFQQSTFKSIRKGDIAGLCGFDPKYDDTSFFSAKGHIIPLHSSPQFTYDDTYFSVSVGNYLHHVEKERRGVMQKFFKSELDEIVKESEDIPLVNYGHHNNDSEKKVSQNDRIQRLEEFLSYYFLDTTDLVRAQKLEHKTRVSQVN
ncbi:hypothetical protein G9A89_023396 [Geosiphon pyriformis]|nr:hypothetical protein G9A89_023396 [Geosiphon pyriformis]